MVTHLGFYPEEKVKNTYLVLRREQYHMKVLLNSFHLNGHTLKLHPQVKISLYNITKERTVQYRHTQGLHSQAKSHPNQKADNLKVPLFDSFPFGCHSHEFIPVYRRKGLNVNLDNVTKQAVPQEGTAQ